MIMKNEAQGSNQKSIDIMGEHLLERLSFFAESDDFDTMSAIYSEWIVDGRNPEDGEYEFTFVPSLIDN